MMVVGHFVPYTRLSVDEARDRETGREARDRETGRVGGRHGGREGGTPGDNVAPRDDLLKVGHAERSLGPCGAGIVLRHKQRCAHTSSWLDLPCQAYMRWNSMPLHLT